MYAITLRKLRDKSRDISANKQLQILACSKLEYGVKLTKHSEQINSGLHYRQTDIIKWKFLGDLIYQGTVFCQLFPCYSLNEN